MDEWQTEPLVDCLAALIDYRGKSPPKSATGIPVLSAKVVKTTGLLRPIEQTIAPDYYLQWMTRGMPQPGDVIMTTEGPMGQVIQLDEETARFALGQRIICMRGEDRKLDNTFLRYLLTSPMQQEILTSYATGTTVLGISQKALRSMPISFPDFSEQEQTGQVLAALDDKIELNRRMNETLEAMAWAIFKDWFVDFGPTRAKVEGRAPYLAAELWDLFPDALNDDHKPVGWTEIPLNQLGMVITGKTPSTKRPEFFGDDMPFLKIPDMHGRIYVLRTSTELSEEGARSQEKKTLPAGSVSVSCIATPGLVIFNHRDTQTNQQINSIIPTDLEQSHFVFWSCKQLASAVMLGGSGGSVFHNMNKTSFENLRLVYPGDEIAQTYSKTVSQIHNRILSNEYESDVLAQIRDLLLPKLMSGEIRLAEAEKAVGRVA